MKTSTKLHELYPSLNEELINGLQPVLCPFNISLPLSIKNQIELCVEEFLRAKKEVHKKSNPLKTWENSPVNSLDFHFSSGTLKLIEANTNASGYLVSQLLLSDNLKALQFEKTIFSSFLTCFEDTPLKIYICDKTPVDEKMYPEFLMYKDMFERQGLPSEILPTAELSEKNGKLFVYNRDTDFYLSSYPVLKEKYETGLIKLCPSPLAYESLASKKQPLLHPDQLGDLGYKNLKKTLLSTHRFFNSSKEELWTKRKNFFFKPLESYGSKGVYAGKSISRSKFETLDDNYLAQELHPPGKVEHNSITWKFDIRAFFSEASCQKIIARVYQGQVTNFSNLGGGLALIDWT